jgi:spermidine synthase
MVISSALFGFGLSALFYYILKQRSPDRSDYKKILTISTLMLPLAVILSLVIITNIPLTVSIYIFLPAFFIASAIPFFFGGLTIVAAISHFGKAANIIYFSDLAGAGTGTLLSILLISFLSGENALLALAILASLAAISHSLLQDQTRVKILTVFILVFSISTVSLNFATDSLVIDSGYRKFLFSNERFMNDKEIIYTKWNVFSRIDVVSEPTGPTIEPIVPFTPFWGLSDTYSGSIPKHQGLFIDADAYTPILKWNGDLNDPEIRSVLYDLPNFAHTNYTGNHQSLILGSGGGKDVLAALLAGSNRVVAVEINPLIVDYMRGISDYNGGIYDHPNVEAVVNDARNFVLTTDSTFDFVQLAFIASWTAVTSGGYSLSEGFIYTEEAFGDYYTALSPDGILSITYWAHSAVKLALTSYKALQSLGIEDIDSKFFMVTNDQISTVLLKKGSFSSQEADSLKQKANDLQFRVIYDPSNDTFNEVLSQPPYLNLPKATVRDDSPFFFRDLRLVNLPLIGSVQLPIAILFVLLIEGLIITLVSLVLPMSLFMRWKSGILLKNWKLLTFFSCLGVGFILFEIVLLPKFTLYLGSPLYSLSLIVFSLLLASGIGSYFSPKFEKKMTLVAFSLCIIMVLYAFLLGGFFSLTASFSLLQRAIATIALVMMPGFLMGMFLPTGIRLVNSREPQITPWMWTINSVTSVLGTVIAQFGALLVGLTFDILLAALIYIVAIVLLRSALRE